MPETTTTMSDPYADIRARLDAATPGPWETDGPLIVASNLEIAETMPTDGADGRRAAEDADLIAHAPDDLTRLLADVDRLRDERDATRAAIDRVSDLHADDGSGFCEKCPCEEFLCETRRTLDGDEAEGWDGYDHVVPEPPGWDGYDVTGG